MLKDACHNITEQMKYKKPNII